jgi:hypothetical protein
VLCLRLYQHSGDKTGRPATDDAALSLEVNDVAAPEYRLDTMAHHRNTTTMVYPGFDVAMPSRSRMSGSRMLDARRPGFFTKRTGRT